MMLQSDDVSGEPLLDFEAWRDLLRTMGGRYYSEGVEPDTFAGWVRPVSVCGFTALDIGCNADRIERTYRDARLDSADNYCTVFQVAGQAAMAHNDQAVQLAVGDVAFVDHARPVTYFANNGNEAWNTLTLSLPRQSLVSHLGFEPQGGLYRRGGTSAGRLLFSLIRDADGCAHASAAGGPTITRLALPNVLVMVVQASIGLIDIYFVANALASLWSTPSITTARSQEMWPPSRPTFHHACGEGSLSQRLQQ